MMRPKNLVKCAAITVAMTVLPHSALASGATTYGSRCSMCHQPNGAGLPGQFPRLAGRAAQIASKPEGRSYLVKVLLFGLYGSVKVDGKPITGMMPAVGTMADQDIADVLNHAVGLQKPAKAVSPFTGGEVSKIRGEGKLTSAGVASIRNGLVAKGIVP